LFFTSIKSADFQLCCAILKKEEKNSGFNAATLYTEADRRSAFASADWARMKYEQVLEELLAEADAEIRAIFPWGVPPHWRGREDSFVHIAQCLLSYIEKLIIFIISLLILLHFMVYHPDVVISVIILSPFWRGWFNI
jgi:hypothetical protein